MTIGRAAARLGRHPAALALWGLALAGAASAAASPVVTEVRLGGVEGHFVVEIASTETLKYAQVESGSEPFTLTFYLLDAILAFPAVTRDVGEGPLKQVTASVLQREESRVARIDLVFERLVPFRVAQDDKRLTVHLREPAVTTRVVLRGAVTASGDPVVPPEMPRATAAPVATLPPAPAITPSPGSAAGSPARPTAAPPPRGSASGGASTAAGAAGGFATTTAPSSAPSTAGPPAAPGAASTPSPLPAMPTLPGPLPTPPPSTAGAAPASPGTGSTRPLGPAPAGTGAPSTPLPTGQAGAAGGSGGPSASGASAAPGGPGTSAGAGGGAPRPSSAPNSVVGSAPARPGGVTAGAISSGAASAGAAPVGAAPAGATSAGAPPLPPVAPPSPPPAPRSQVARAHPQVAAPATRVTRLAALTSAADTQVRIVADGRLSFRSFVLQNPTRVVVDLEGVSYRFTQPSLTLDSPLIERVRAARFRATPTEVVRVVIDLRKAAPHWVEALDDGVVVHVGSAGPGR